MNDTGLRINLSSSRYLSPFRFYITAKRYMRRDCETCGEFVECNKDGICASCVLEDDSNETTEEGEGEEEKA